MSAEQPGWKAGVARVAITPDAPMWLAGYGGLREGESVLHDLWVKALALEDAEGNRAVLVTDDLCGLPKDMYDRLLATLREKHGLRREQLRFCNSHNHCAPIVGRELQDYYPLTAAQWARVDEYSAWLEKQMVEVVGQALAALQPVELAIGEGVCTFAGNRRNNLESEVPGMLARGEPLKGPVDHAVPVLAVREPSGSLLAVVFGYACHNTTLAFRQWCGDYAGFAQLALERSHQGTQAMFFMGCGGDQNPLPRRSVELAEKYGNMLAAAVEVVLAGPMQPVAPRLRMAQEVVPLAFEANPTREELEEIARGENEIHARWARRMLQRLDRGEVFEREYPYVVQAWRLGDELLWIGMAGEPVVDYALRFKREFGPKTWVNGYIQDLVSYIPSRRVWEEGGYEGAFLYEYGLPAHRYAGDVEERIAAAVHRVVQAVGPLP